ncbi:unnamed protein product [Caenorhabditis brenneri]
MQSVDLKKRAFKLLKAHDVSDLIWCFNPTSVVEAHRQKLVITAKLEDLKVDRMSGNGVSVFTFGTLGQLFSRICYMLRENWDDAGMDKIVQNNINYVQLSDPSPGDTIFFVATFLPGQNGTDHLVFCIESEGNGQKKIFGNGSSSIAIFQPTVSDASEETTRRDGSSQTEAPTTLPSGQPTSSASSAPRPTASETTTSTTSARTSRAEAAKTPGAPSLAVLGPEVIKPSILRRPATNGLPAAKRRRHVSFAESGKERTASFMLMNIRTRHPKTDKKLEKMLGELGVKPEEVRFEALPMKTTGRYAYFFKVTSSTGCSKIENLIETRDWQDLFHVIYLSSANSEPFLWTALPMNSIIETMFLAQRVALRSDQRGVEDDLNHQLANKEFLGRALNDVSLTEEVMGALNQRGRSIFKKQIKPQATIM